MGNIQFYIASKQPVSAGSWGFKPWTPGEGATEGLEPQGWREGGYHSCMLLGLLPEPAGGLTLQREVYRSGLLK